MPILRTLLLCAVFCVAVPLHAQSKPPISCAQALQMGFDKFVEAETERTKDYSTAGMNSTYDRYRKCKRVANDRAIKAVHSPQKPHVATARQELDNLESAIWTMIYIEAGGGTMYSQFAAASSATREDVVSNLIVALRWPLKNSSSGPLKIYWSQADRELTPHFKTPTTFLGTAFGSATEDRKQYAKSVREAQAAMKALKVLSARLPPAAAKVVARRVAHSASASFKLDD